jgi:hypothetical protein
LVADNESRTHCLQLMRLAWKLFHPSTMLPAGERSEPRQAKERVSPQLLKLRQALYFVSLSTISISDSSVLAISLAPLL